MNNNTFSDVLGIKAIFIALGVVISNITLNEWVSIATLVYVVLQSILLIPKFISWFRRK